MSRQPRLTIMISSTARDLPEHRKQVMDACLAQGMFPEMMEHLPASDADAIAASLRMVDEADVYLGVFAWRYGYVPKGHEISITEMEYNRAVERGVPRLLFFMHEDHPVKAADVEKGPGAAKLEAFKQRMAVERVANFFKSPEDLRAQVINSLSKLNLAAASSSPSASSDQRRAMPQDTLPANSGSGSIATGGSVAAGAGGVAVGGNVYGNIVVNQGRQTVPGSLSSDRPDLSSLPVKLTGPQFGQFQKALVSAFTTKALSMMVTTQLGENLEAIADMSKLDTAAFDLIGWAQRTGKLPDLIRGALAANPESPDLKAFVASLGG